LTLAGDIIHTNESTNYKLRVYGLPRERKNRNRGKLKCHTQTHSQSKHTLRAGDVDLPTNN